MSHRTPTIIRHARCLAFTALLTPALLLTACSSSKPVATAPSSADRSAENDLGRSGNYYRDPFAQFAGQRGTVTTPTTVVPTSFREANVGTDGVSRSPNFSLFGEIPNANARSRSHTSLPDGTENIRQISFSAEGIDFDPTISPDGRTIYFSSTRHRPTASIYSKSIDGTAVTQLTSDPAHDIMPAVSPDGSRIAFASNRNGSWDIYVMNVEGGQAVQITSDTAHDLHPTWSPDGRSISFCRLGETSDRWEIWITDVRMPSRLKFLTYGLFPEWQPGGNKIMFQRARDRGGRLFSLWTIDYINGEATMPTEIASSSVAAIINPSWSWDGEFVAFSTVFNPPVDDTQKPDFADIWIQRLDGSSRTNLTGGWFVNVMPTWGPDNRIYFISDRSGNDNIWSIGPEQAITAAGFEMPRRTDLANVPVNPND
ncbi:MAG: TolB family protein [Phycisphaerales bacterium]